MPVLLPVKHLNPERVYLLCSTRTEKVARRLQRLVQNADLVTVNDGYDIVELEEEIRTRFKIDGFWVINITGGTKPMSIAACNVARMHHVNTIYFQSEGKRPLLYEYYFRDYEMLRREGTPIELPDLITVDEYIKAHLGDYEVNGPHRDKGGTIDSGGKFEETIFNILKKNNIETLCGVRPKGPDSQIEYDLIMRLKNNVGVAECKLGAGDMDRQKRPFEQLAFETQREYFGIYTERFLITGGRIDNRLHKLAIEKKYSIVELTSYRDGKLSFEDERYLVKSIKSKLLPE